MDSEVDLASTDDSGYIMNHMQGYKVSISILSILIFDKLDMRKINSSF